MLKNLQKGKIGPLQLTTYCEGTVRHLGAGSDSKKSSCCTSLTDPSFQDFQAFNVPYFHFLHEGEDLTKSQFFEGTQQITQH
jgi:hypothetical protein